MYSSRLNTVLLLFFEAIVTQCRVIGDLTGVEYKCVTNYQFYHVEPDKYVQNDPTDTRHDVLLLSTETSIVNLEVDTCALTTLTGKTSRGYADGSSAVAMFSRPYRLLENESGNETYIADTSNHCIRLLSRPDLVTSTKAGQCESRGISSGKLRSPISLIFDDSDLLVVESDTPPNRLLRVDPNTGDITQLYTHYNYLRDLFKLEDTNWVYVLANINPFRYDLVTSTTESLQLFGTTVKNPGHMEFLDNTKTSLLIVDTVNYVLRWVNYETSISKTICSGTSGTSDGDTKNCQLSKPWMTSWLNDRLYLTTSYGLAEVTIACQQETYQYTCQTCDNGSCTQLQVDPTHSRRSTRIRCGFLCSSHPTCSCVGYVYEQTTKMCRIITELSTAIPETFNSISAVKCIQN